MMEKPLFDASIKAAQYLSSLTSQQDVWSETGKVITHYFGADLTGFAERRADGEIVGHHWTLPDGVSYESILTAETKGIIKEVLESGFLASRVVYVPDPYSLAFLPITQENETTAVMLVGHRMAEPLPKGLLDIYLAVAGLAGTTITRLAWEEKTEHLNLVLRAIRRVNQLIVTEKDSHRLCQGTCDNLIETRGYNNAWIALLDEAGGLVATAEAGLGDDFPLMVRQLKRGQLPSCGPKALSQSGVVVVKDPASTCADCPLSAKYAGQGGMSIRLEHGGKVYGLLVVSMPAQFVTDEEELGLFEEVAGDIGFALHAMELEEKQKRAEEELKQYSERLEEMVEERTKELRDAQEELVRKEKLAILGQLAGGVAHELRNPLGVISNAIYYLQVTLPDADETTQEYLEMISSEVRNSEKMVSDLLDFSRTRPAGREEVAVSDLVAEVLERQPPPQKVKVTTKIASDLPLVFVDPGQIGQVLDNLVTNAYQAMPEGGKLTMSAQGEKEKVYLSITDTGCGIPQENMGRLFEPLFTTKARGIGLGLAVSKNLVEVNGGSIEVESPSTSLRTGEEGKGSTFTVILPTKEVQS